MLAFFYAWSFFGKIVLAKEFFLKPIDFLVEKLSDGLFVL